MVPANILQRTFHIAHNGEGGTAFTIDVDNRQYLVTARHVVKMLLAGTSISLLRGGNWISIAIGDVWFPDSGADLALISPKQQLSPTHPVTTGNSATFYLSQQIYFLGFPYGLHMPLGAINNDFPVPFVKTGIVASFTEANTGSQIIFCDGHNNSGFSGGPIVTVSNTHVVNIIGVVSGYRHNDDEILLNGKKTGLTYRANTGLVIGYGLREILERIQNSPTGALIS